MLHKKYEKGQAIIIIVFAIIGLIALTGLAVDGSRAYADRRNAQGAADSAAWAAALASTRGEDMQSAAAAIANQNGFTDGARSDVVVTPTNLPSGVGPEDCKTGGMDIKVEITSRMDTFFAQVIGVRKVTNKVQAVTRACNIYYAGAFGGNAIVSINDQHPSNCGFDSNTGSATWTVKGGGIFSNGCAASKGNVVFDPSYCASAVAGATGFGSKACTGGTPSAYSQVYIDGIMPPDPCVSGGIGKPQSGGVSVTNQGQTTITFSGGIYCIADMDAFTSADVVLNNATLYVTDKSFNLNFSGGGGFSGASTGSGTFANLYMVIPQDPTDPTCSSFTSHSGDQVINYRGNASGIPNGTILAPGACVDLRGGSTSSINGQVVGYTVSANGNADTTINYTEDTNYKPPVYPTIQLIK